MASDGCSESLLKLLGLSFLALVVVIAAIMGLTKSNEPSGPTVTCVPQWAPPEGWHDVGKVVVPKEGDMTAVSGDLELSGRTVASVPNGFFARIEKAREGEEFVIGNIGAKRLGFTYDETSGGVCYQEVPTGKSGKFINPLEGRQLTLYAID